MTRGLTWAEQARAQLEHDKQQLAAAQNKVAYWTDRVHHLEKYIELHQQHQLESGRVIVDTSVLLGMSVNNALIKLAESNHGLLVTREAAQTLLKAGVFSKHRDAYTNLFSTLRRSKHFQKERPGVYKLRLAEQVSQLALKPPQPRRPLRSRVRSGVVRAVEEIVLRNPRVTLPEIKEQLAASAFDFKGRKPIQAINMALNRMKKKQALPSATGTAPQG